MTSQQLYLAMSAMCDLYRELNRQPPEPCLYWWSGNYRRGRWVEAELSELELLRARGCVVQRGYKTCRPFESGPTTAEMRNAAECARWGF